VAPPAPPCPVEPTAGCLAADKAKIGAKDSTDGSKRKLLWKWGVDSGTTDLGDPTTSTSYRLCLYAGTSSVDISVGVPGGSSAWKATSTGFTYKDPSAGGDGAFKAVLKTTPSGKIKILLKAKGANLDLDALPIGLTTEPLLTQLLRNDDPTCWEASFATLTKDDGTQLKAKTP
jgi:hypothetical protein